MGRTIRFSGLAMSCIVAWTCFDAQVTLPAIVHSIAGDKDRAVRAAIAYPALTVGSIAVGFLVGFAASAGDDEFTTNSRPFYGAIGGSIGAAVAWLAWGLFDVGLAADGSTPSVAAR